MSGHAILCRFSSLDDLPKRERNMAGVLRALDRVKKFSTFEACNYAWLGGLLTRAAKEGLAEFDHEKHGYPWTAVTLTAKGREMIGAHHSARPA